MCESASNIDELERLICKQHLISTLIEYDRKNLIFMLEDIPCPKETVG